MGQVLIEGIENAGPQVRGAMLTIGNFDGVHLGHQLILRTARELADRGGLKVVAMTFQPPPDLVLRPQDPPQRISPLDVRCSLLGRAGADAVIVARSTAELLSLEAEEFIDQVIGPLAPRAMVEGHDFCFGRARRGTLETLQSAGKSRDFTVHVVEPVEIDLPSGRHRVSSTLVRGLVISGLVDQAGRCLGRPFALYGRVIPGAGQGKFIEFPTANIDPGEQVCPADGVYAGWAELGRNRFPAAISVGHKPTLGPSKDKCVEAFLLGASGDYYAKPMTLAFLQMLRSQQRFDDLDTLRVQIKTDVEAVRRIVGGALGGGVERNS